MPSPILLRALSPAVWTPDRWYHSGEPGDYWHLANLDGIYQESTGITPAAVGQAVGLMLGRRYGGARGVEQAAATYGTSATSNNVTTPTSATSFTTTAGTTACRSYLNLTGAASSAYEVTFRITAISSSTVLLLLRDTVAGGGNTTAQSAAMTVGTYTYRIGPGNSATPSLVWVNLTAGTTFNVDSISVREIPGLHRIQSTAINRPILQSDYSSLYDGTDDSDSSATGGGGTTGFIFIGAIKVVGGAGANRTLWSDTGTNTGYRVRINSSNQLELAAGNGSGYTTAATTETLAAGSKYVVAAWHDGVNLNVRLGLGPIYQAAFATASAGTAGFTMFKDNGAASSYANVQCYGSVYVSNSAKPVSQIQQAIRYYGTLGGVGL